MRAGAGGLPPGRRREAGSHAGAGSLIGPAVIRGSRTRPAHALRQPKFRCGRPGSGAGRLEGEAWEIEAGIFMGLTSRSASVWCDRRGARARRAVAVAGENRTDRHQAPADEAGEAGNGGRGARIEGEEGMPRADFDSGAASPPCEATCRCGTANLRSARRVPPFFHLLAPGRGSTLSAGGRYAASLSSGVAEQSFSNAIPASSDRLGLHAARRVRRVSNLHERPGERPARCGHPLSASRHGIFRSGAGLRVLRSPIVSLSLTRT
jgi:hypothetical protein